MNDYSSWQKQIQDAVAPAGKSLMPERKTAKLNKQRRLAGLSPVGPKTAADHSYVVRK